MFQLSFVLFVLELLTCLSAHHLPSLNPRDTGAVAWWVTLATLQCSLLECPRAAALILSQQLLRGRV